MFQHETSTFFWIPNFFMNTEIFWKMFVWLQNIVSDQKKFSNFFYEYRFFFESCSYTSKTSFPTKKIFWKKSPYNMPHYSYHTLEQSLALRTHGSVLLVCLRCIVSVAKPLVVSAYPWVRLTYLWVHLAYPWIHIVYPWVHLTYPWVHLPYPWVHLTYPWAHLA